MIKKAVFENDLILGMQRELQSYDKKVAMDNLGKAGGYLHAAMEIFEEAGLTAQAEALLVILTKIANEGKKPGDVIEFTSLTKDPKKKHHDKEHHNKEEKIEFTSLMKGDKQDAKSKSHKTHDPHTQGLTPEKMVENLKHHGIVFNMADDGQADTMLDVELSDDNDLEVTDPHHVEKDFEDEN